MSEKEEQECGKVKPLTGHQIRSAKSPVTTHKCKYIELSLPYRIYSHAFFIIPCSLSTEGGRLALCTAERHLACQMLDFLAPLLFDSLSTHSTILKSISCSRI